MDIYTVTSRDELDTEPSAQCVAGSYVSRGDALRECAEYVMERARARPGDIGHMLRHDEYHPDFPKRGGGRQKAYILDELGGQGCYYIHCRGYGTVRFDVDENDVEGELWHTVTWGDSDCEEPEFTTPWPEAFTSEEAAIYSFYCYALDLKRDHGIPVSEGFRPFVYDSLRKDGKCQVCLSDGCSVSCVLYPDDARNIKE